MKRDNHPTTLKTNRGQREIPSVAPAQNPVTNFNQIVGKLLALRWQDEQRRPVDQPLAADEQPAPGS